MRFEHRLIAELTPGKNPRVHPEAQISAIAGSIRRFGFNAPVVIDATGTILAGHGRVAAAKVLGLDTVPCVVTDLEGTDARAYLLADNELTGSWDDEMLGAELEDLGEFMTEMGFAAEEFDALRQGWESDIQPPKEKEEQGRVVLRCPQEAIGALTDWLNSLTFPCEVEI